MQVEIEIRPEGVFVADSDIAVGCQWFARCDRDAVDTRRHLIIGDTPVCAHCAAFVDRMSGGTR